MRKSSPELFPQAEESCEAMYTDHYMEPDADTNMAQPNSAPTNPRRTTLIYAINRSRTATTITYTKSLRRPTMAHRTHTYTFRKS